MPVWLSTKRGTELPQGPEESSKQAHEPQGTHFMGHGEEGCSGRSKKVCKAHANPEGDLVFDPFQQSAIDALKSERKILKKARRLLKRVKGAIRRLVADEDVVYDPHDGAFELWPNGIVRYTFSSSMNNQCTEVMLKAMKEWEAKTCIRFEQQSAPGNGVVTYQSSGQLGDGRVQEGCWASLGYSTHWEHRLNLGEGCCDVGVAIHELGHTIGLRHEHNRPEARDYIAFRYENMQEWWKQWMEFADDWGDVSAGVPYDMSSIMHYHSRAGASKAGLETITVKKADVFGNCRLGQRDYISEGDLLTINRWYGCPDHFCADLHAGCEHWKEEGFCTREYEEWMASNCPHSCGVCECEDEAQYASQCPAWADLGYCWRGDSGSKHDKEFMVKNCRKSCGNCLMEDANACQDKPLWGDEDGCKKNPNGVRSNDRFFDCGDDWFVKTCAKTCGLCPHKPFCW